MGWREHSEHLQVEKKLNNITVLKTAHRFLCWRLGTGSRFRGEAPEGVRPPRRDSAHVRFAMETFDSLPRSGFVSFDRGTRQKARRASG